MKVEHYHIFHKTKSGLVTTTKCDYQTLYETPKVGQTVKSHYGERVEFFNFEYASLDGKDVMYQNNKIVEIDNNNIIDNIKLQAEIYLNALYNLRSIEDLNVSYRDEASYLKNVEYAFRDFIEANGQEFDIRYSKMRSEEEDIVQLLKDSYNELTVLNTHSKVDIAKQNLIKYALNYSMTKVAYELDSYFDEDVVYTSLLTRYDDNEESILDSSQAEILGSKIFDFLSYENKKLLLVDLTANEKMKKNQKFKKSL